MVWHRKSISLTTSALIIGVMLMTVACQSTEPSPSPTPEPVPTPTPAPIPAPGITFYIDGDARMDKEVYLVGEEAAINLSFENLTGDVFQLEPFPPEVRIMRRYPYDEIACTFPAGTESRSLEPGEIASYTLTWDQRDDQGHPVPYGYYYLEFGRVRRGYDWITISRHRYISLLILPEEGVIEETIELNESKTVDGITITLEHVELSATEAKFYAFNTPLDYDLPQGPNLPPPSLMSLHAEAEYSLDGKQIIEAGLSGIRFLDNGMRHTWDMLDPVSKGTKEIAFTITKLGEWEGPWEFHVPLE